MKANQSCIGTLTAAGIAYDDAMALRRISMTLHRWHELECGDGNDYGSWAIETLPVTKTRLRKMSMPSCGQYEMTVPAHTECKFIEGNGGGWAVADVSRVKGGNAWDLEHHYIWLKPEEVVELPFMVHHHYMHGRGRDYTTKTRIADREAGAKKRLAKIIARYPGFRAYIQTDPRGCSLYIMRPGDLKDNDDISCCYTRGIAVYK